MAGSEVSGMKAFVSDQEVGSKGYFITNWA